VSDSAPPTRSTTAPSARQTAAVERTSAPSPAPPIRLSPAASVASIRARWLTDLSPGTTSSPRRQAAGRMTAASVEVADMAGPDP
jgi:hypothetical protein